MNGNTIIGGGQVKNPSGQVHPGTNWKAIGAGDYNGDGLSDLLLQNTSGDVSIWEMNGNMITGGGPAGPNPGPDWHAIRTG